MEAARRLRWTEVAPPHTPDHSPDKKCAVADIDSGDGDVVDDDDGGGDGGWEEVGTGKGDGSNQQEGVPCEEEDNMKLPSHRTCVPSCTDSRWRKRKVQKLRWGW